MKLSRPKSIRLIMLNAIMLAAVAAAHGTSSSPDPRPDTADARAQRFVSHHQAMLGGTKLSYTVVAGHTPIKNDRDEVIGRLFSFSYIVDRAAPKTRPVLFVFNGGPGSSSVWLHLGGIGPRKLLLGDPADPRSSNTALIDNPDSPLAVADLVFIDPIGTGFSRFVGKGSESDFFGNNQDAASVGQFIESWLTANRRWESPKFLLGESYGTVRASLLTDVLMGGANKSPLLGVSFQGLILIGHDGGLVPLDSELRFRTNFTTMAATAWYHNRVPHEGRTFEQFIEAARNFAANELGPGIVKSSAGPLDAKEAETLAGHMSEFIGLPSDYIRIRNFRISAVEFSHALLAPSGLEMSVFDGRYTKPGKSSTDAVGLMPAGMDQNVSNDALLSRIAAPFAAAFHAYMSQELGIDATVQYRLLVDLDESWKNRGPRIDPGMTLVNEARRNHSLRVMFMGGWFDVLAGTIGAAELGVESRLKDAHATIKSYWSGHMCYLGDGGRSVPADISAFIKQALQED